MSFFRLKTAGPNATSFMPQHDKQGGAKRKMDSKEAELFGPENGSAATAAVAEV